MTLDEEETRGSWAARQPPDPKPRKFLIVGHPGAGKLLRAREIADESRLWHTRDSARLYAFRVAGLEVPSGVKGQLRAPHHSVSLLGLTGQLRKHQWRPGEIALAHGGTLVLDEAPEFRLEALEAVDRAWRVGRVTLRSDRAYGDLGAWENELRIPTEFDLVVCMNPCPCGYRGDTRPAPVRVTCKCTDRQVARWFDRVAKLAEGAERIDL